MVADSSFYDSAWRFALTWLVLVALWVLPIWAVIRARRE